MNWQRVRITAGVAAFRFRTAVKTVIRFVAVAAVLLAVYNLFGPFVPGEMLEPLAVYPRTHPFTPEGNAAVWYLEDVAVFVAGSVVAWVL